LLTEDGVPGAAIQLFDPFGLSICHVEEIFQAPPPVPLDLKFVWALRENAKNKPVRVPIILLMFISEKGRVQGFLFKNELKGDG
jgi:hypothetical protein